MASVFEINSFVGKFLHLWNTGRNASLNIESQAGNTAVTLRLELGKPGQQPHHFMVRMHVIVVVNDERIEESQLLRKGN